MFHCIKGQHIFDSYIVPGSNDGTTEHSFSWCSTGSTTLSDNIHDAVWMAFHY
jgi:hypothetical protein